MGIDPFGKWFRLQKTVLPAVADGENDSLSYHLSGKKTITTGSILHTMERGGMPDEQDLWRDRLAYWRLMDVRYVPMDWEPGGAEGKPRCAGRRHATW